MHRIDGPGHVGNTFTEGDPSGPTPATRVTADILNALQEEIANVVEHGGGVLNKADNTQLLAKIQALIINGQKTVIIEPATFEGTVADGDVVYYDAGNTRYAKAIADGTVKQQAAGVADVANSKVVAFGDASSLLSGMTAGSRYYLSDATAGAITTASPVESVLIGIAKSATVMHVDVDAASSVPDASSKGWINFNGTGVVSTVDEYNMGAAIIDNGTGHYTLGFTTPLPDTNYEVVGNSTRDSAAEYPRILGRYSPGIKSTTQVEVECVQSGTATRFDKANLAAVIR